MSGKCIKILEKTKEWMSAREIQKEIPDINLGTIRNNLHKLLKWNEILKKEVFSYQGIYKKKIFIYKYKGEKNGV